MIDFLDDARIVQIGFVVNDTFQAKSNICQAFGFENDNVITSYSIHYTKLYEYQVLDREDVAMWGAAMLAGNAIGVFGDLKQTAKEYVQVEKEFTPDMIQKAKFV